MMSVAEKRRNLSLFSIFKVPKRMVMASKRVVAKTWLITVLMGISACTTLPDAVKTETYRTQPTFTTLKTDDPQYLNQAIVVGGKIVEVINKAEQTDVVVLQLPLDSRGQPTDNPRQSNGRFIASFDRLLDPEIYAAGEYITVRGQYQGLTEGSIGDFPYRYVAFNADGIHLWEERETPETRFIFGVGTQIRLHNGSF